MPIYRGVGGTNRKVKAIYRGVNGTNKLLKEVYRGVGGTNRKVFGLEGSWTADGSQKGNLGELQLNVPSSNAKPTILKVGDTRPISESGVLLSTITCSAILLSSSDVIRLDYAFDRETTYRYWIELYIGNKNIDYSICNVPFSRKVQDFTGHEGIFQIKARRSNCDKTNIWGKFTIYNVWLNGIKVL